MVKSFIGQFVVHLTSCFAKRFFHWQTDNNVKVVLWLSWPILEIFLSAFLLLLQWNAQSFCHLTIPLSDACSSGSVGLIGLVLFCPHYKLQSITLHPAFIINFKSIDLKLGQSEVLCKPIKKCFKHQWNWHNKNIIILNLEQMHYWWAQPQK